MVRQTKRLPYLLLFSGIINAESTSKIRTFGCRTRIFNKKAPEIIRLWNGIVFYSIDAEKSGKIRS